MKFFKIDLLTLLISLFILGSCKNDNTLGLDVDPSQQLNGTLVDTATILTNTVTEDSVITTSLVKTPLAYFKDPVLGITEANVATGLNLPGGTAYTKPTGTVTIDSAVLVLPYSDGFYGDSLSSSYKVNVYQLTEKPVSIAYYNNKQWGYNNGTVLGTRTFNARPRTKVAITAIVTGKPDTLRKVSPQIRIKISTAFINNNLFNASEAALASNSNFQNIVKGLYITLDKSAVTGVGGNLMLSLDSSRIDVYYKNQGTSSVDTAIVSLPTGLRAAEIKHTYSTEVQAALANTTTGDNTVYLQGLAGLRTKVRFPFLKSLNKLTDNGIVLNRAELVITAKTGTIIPYAPLPRLTMYRYDIAKQRQLLPDASPRTQTSLGDPRYLSPDIFGAYFYSPKSEYHFVITGYIEDLMRGKTVDYGTFIAPVDTVERNFISASPTAQTPARTVAVGGDKTSPYRMKLNIIYTKINK
jgi:hypothetical protein